MWHETVNSGRACEGFNLSHPLHSHIFIPSSMWHETVKSGRACEGFNHSHLLQSHFHPFIHAA